MFIKDIFAQKKPVLSFEVFPPKKDSGLDNVISAVDELSKMPIDYMSVTYGAGGSNSKNTAYIASHLKNNLSIPSLAHLTCVANSKDDIKVKLQEYKDLGIENILALVGKTAEDLSARNIVFLADSNSSGAFQDVFQSFNPGLFESQLQEQKLIPFF